jgi:hypothetical protein
MAEIGVDTLNLHQLVANENNYRRLARRGYTYLAPAAFREAPVLESELAALRLIAYAAEQELPLAINYCSHIYKARVQNAARRARAAALARQPGEWITAAGYLGRLTPAGDGPATLAYFQADLTDRPTAHTVAELPLGERKTIYLERKPALGPRPLSTAEAHALMAAVRTAGADRPTPAGLPADALPFEDPGDGLQPILADSARPTTSYLDLA